MGRLDDGIGDRVRGALGLICSMLVAVQAALYLVVLAVVLLPGWRVSAVESGSMMPVLAVGDVVLTHRPSGTPGVGAVVLVDRSGDDPLLHRVTAIADDGTLTTKGDANAEADSTPVDPDDVLGIGRIALPAIGLPSIWLAHGDHLPALLALACELLVFGFARQIGRANQPTLGSVFRAGLPLTSRRVAAVRDGTRHALAERQP